MYTLTINIDSQGRQFLLDNNETIVLVSPQDIDYNYSVACVSFSPFGNSNTVVFNNTWIEYASSQNIQFNEVILMGMTENASKGNIYIFNGISIIQGGAAYSNEVYGLSNKGADIDNLTCGLGQLITINSDEAQNCPLSVYSTPYNQTTYFQATTKIWIFVASGIEAGMIIATQMLTPIGSTQFENGVSGALTVGDYLEIDLTENPTVSFDATINAFKL
ncbi:MAG: hypothetical protein V4561_08360 [Bacteroidota bacterium]